MLFYKAIELVDISGCFKILANVRENKISKDELQQNGVTLENFYHALEHELITGYICCDNNIAIGFSLADIANGEILSLAVLPEYEALGIGKKLLGELSKLLKAYGFSSIRLSASADSNTRAYGFYRHLGWHPSGEYNSFDDEILIKHL